MTDNSDNLIERKIVNYLRKHSSNNKNLNKTKNKILGLFYKRIENIPINDINNDINENWKEFPYYFQTKTKEEILELFNSKVCPRKTIKYPFNLIDYDIKPNNYLEISKNTFRPIYKEDWKKQTEILNNCDYKNQQSFYMEYLRYYLKYKKFPSFSEFLIYLYYKYEKPVHKDIKIVYENINKSYEPIKEFIEKNNISFNEIKEILIKSASIQNRIIMQQFQ